MRNRLLLLVGLLIALVVVLLVTWPSVSSQHPVSAEPEILASPVHAGCYIAGPSDCRIHVEPFTINIQTGSKLALFRLVAIRMGTGTQTTIYDFRPDQSNPAPPSGLTYTPSLVTQDFAATCGKTYEISLQGRDSIDVNVFNLGLTGQFTCPTGVP
jgi:hypothetical protein